ncbi:S9 family peptidase [bacterium]|nr:S9 family peptidase [bacterium]
MHPSSKKLRILLFLILLIPVCGLSAQDTQPEKRPLELWDMAEWKSIRSTALANNGEWFAWLAAPTEGDSKVYVKSTTDTTSYAFDVGKTSFGRILFSDDSRWVAFSVSPTTAESEKLEKQKKKSYNDMTLLDLVSGDDTTFTKVSDFRFSGENPGWLAMKKYAPEGKPEKDAGKGTGLILHELATAKQLYFGDVAGYGFDKYGRYLVLLIDADDKAGNGIQLRSMKTGVIQVLDNDDADYERLNWTDEGDGFAVLKGSKHDDYEEMLYSVLGFKNLEKNQPVKVVFDPCEEPSLPDTFSVSPKQTPAWGENLTFLTFGIREVALTDKAKERIRKEEEKKKADMEKEAADSTGTNADKKPEKKVDGRDDEGDLPKMVIWHWRDKRLQSQQWVQETMDKNYSYDCYYNPAEKRFIRLSDDDVRHFTVMKNGDRAVGTDQDPYLPMGNMDGRRYLDVYTTDLKTGERDKILEKLRWYFGPSPEGTHLLYYRDGDYYTFELKTGRSYNITKGAPVSFIDVEDDHNVKDPPIRPQGWLKDDAGVLLSDGWDLYIVSVHGGKVTRLTPDGREKQIRYQSRVLTYPEEEGIDFSDPQYFSSYGEWTKKHGIIRIVKNQAESLLWDDALFSRLMKAEDAGVFLYTRETNSDYPEYYVSDAGLARGRKLTDTNPQQKDFLWSAGLRIIDYVSENGDKLQGILYLPAGYEEGKQYPTIVYMYEKLSQRANAYPRPGIAGGGFNQAYYLSHGYAVFNPDIVFKVNDPGLSSVACIVPAVKAAIATGIVDKDRIGIHGHSWGGYQTAFIITQTDMFKAAIAGAPLTNMISMYSSIYWNSGGGNMAIFESSQGRFYGGYWDNLDAYTRNSPVYHAGKVNTPLIILHNDKDGAVDYNQGVEYYNTLRRLEKPVVMLEYKGENHGLSKMENKKDYMVRMKEFFDHYLKGEEAPEWWVKGVDHLDLTDHLKARAKLLKAQKKENGSTDTEKKAEKTEE